MRIKGLRSRSTGHRKVGFVAASALAAVAMLTLSAVAVAASGPILATKGAGNEGPYPYAYPASGKIAAGTGTTLGGAKCTPGTLQFNSAYVAPCVPKFTGNNGGATSNGVTASTITLAQIEYPASANEQELEAEAAKLWNIIDVKDQTARNITSALNTMNRIHIRRAKLLGLDAPTKLDVGAFYARGTSQLSEERLRRQAVLAALPRAEQERLYDMFAAARKRAAGGAIETAATPAISGPVSRNDPESESDTER